MATPRERRIRLANGIELAFLEWTPDAPSADHSVFLVHGFLDLSWTWKAVVEAGLVGRFHVIAPDMRGHGDSEWIGHGGYYHFMDYVADLAELVDELARDRVSLVGHSMGGSVVAYLAGTRPERIHRLALLEGLGPPEDHTSPPERTAHWLHAWKRARTSEPRRYADLAAVEARLCKADPRLDPALATFLAERGTRETPSGERVFKHDPLHLTQGPYPFRRDVAEAFWRRIACPALLVEGADSPFRLLPDLEARVACLSSPRRVVLPNAAHMLQRHQPAALAEALLAHLT